MKTSLFATLAATALLTATSAFAAPTPANDHDRDGRYQQGPATATPPTTATPRTTA